MVVESGGQWPKVVMMAAQVVEGLNIMSSKGLI